MSEDTSTKKKNWFVRHKILTGLLAIIVIAVIASIAGGGSSSNSKSTTSPENNTSATPESQKTDTQPKIGETARDGKFEFVVKGLTCGKASVGTNEYLTKTAQGQYCLLSTSIKNIGDEPQSLFSSNQYLYNASDQKYAADDVATTYAAPQGNTWYSEINPGNSVEGVIVFDIPKDQVPTLAELHDSAFSDGVKINLQ